MRYAEVCIMVCSWSMSKSMVWEELVNLSSLIWANSLQVAWYDPVAHNLQREPHAANARGRDASNGTPP